MKAYGYCRVSTGKQLESALSIRDQVNQLIRYAEFRGLDLGPETTPTLGDGETIASRERIVIEGISAYSVPFGQRPGGQWIGKHATKGDAVIVCKIDRVFRDTIDALTTAKAFKASDIAFHVCDLGMDLSTPIGEVVLTVMAMVARMESRNRSERMLAAFRAAWSTNPARTMKCTTRIPGGGGPIVGFKLVGELRRGECHLEPDEDLRWFQDALYEMWAGGWSGEATWRWLWSQRIARPDGERWSLDVIREAIAVEHGMRGVEREWNEEGVEFTYDDVAVEWLSRHAAAGLRRRNLMNWQRSPKSVPPVERQSPLKTLPPFELPPPKRTRPA